MEKTNGSIISNYGEGTREDFLFTYSEQEKQENKKNKNNAGLINTVDFYPIYTEYNGKMSLEAKVLMGFFRYRCKNGSKIYQSNEDLAVLLECSTDTVKRRLKELKDLGLIDYSITHTLEGTERLFWLNTTQSANCTVRRVHVAPSYNNYNTRWDIFLTTDILEGYSMYLSEIFGDFPEKELEKYQDILEDFIVYRCETDKKGIPRWKKQTTWSVGGRLARWKKNNDTNFGRKKPEFPLEEIKNASANYYMYYERKPELAKPYEEILKKYKLLDNGKRKEYARMVFGSGFVK